MATDKNDGTVALVKTGSEIVKSTPAGEYLTAALNDFDPDQYEGHAAISDGANKLLMLVCMNDLFMIQFSENRFIVTCADVYVIFSHVKPSLSGKNVQILILHVILNILICI